MMNQSDIENIIAETFRLSGVKLTPDDPIIPILLIMEGRLKALFAEQRVHTRQDFDEITAEIEAPLRLWLICWQGTAKNCPKAKDEYPVPFNKKLQSKLKHILMKW